MSDERTAGDIFKELLQNPHARRRKSGKVEKAQILGPLRKKIKRRTNAIELPGLTSKFDDENDKRPVTNHVKIEKECQDQNLNDQRPTQR